MLKYSRVLSAFVAVCFSFTGMVQSAQAALVSTEQVAISQGATSESAARARVLATLERADVAAALVERGVSLEQARDRVAALTDAEAAHVAKQIDNAPAGGISNVLGAIVFIFVLLLITDVLGFTKVFPFTSSIR